MMRPAIMLVALLLLTLPASTAMSHGPANYGSSVSDAAKVNVYYFHGTRRCKTCLSIERISRGIVKDQYGENERVVFRAVNIEKKENRKLAEQYKVAGSALLVCCGDKQVDLTAKAFQYALSSPDKLQELLISTVDTFLK